VCHDAVDLDTATTLVYPFSQPLDNVDRRKFLCSKPDCQRRRVCHICRNAYYVLEGVRERRTINRKTIRFWISYNISLAICRIKAPVPNEEQFLFEAGMGSEDGLNVVYDCYKCNDLVCDKHITEEEGKVVCSACSERRCGCCMACEDYKVCTIAKCVTENHGPWKVCKYCDATATMKQFNIEQRLPQVTGPCCQECYTAELRPTVSYKSTREGRTKYNEGLAPRVVPKDDADGDVAIKTQET
jgi:hypothetical protein